MDNFVKTFLAISGIIGTIVATILLVQIDISDKTPPKIEFANSGEIYAHSKEPFVVNFSDESGLENIVVELQNEGQGGVKIFEENFKKEPPKEFSVSLKLPPSTQKGVVTAYATDASGGLLKGNSASLSKKILADTTPPQISLIAKNFVARNGGAVMVSFAVKDEHFASVHLVDNQGKIYHPKKFVAQGVYAAFVGVWDEDFALSIVAKDEAGNVAEKSVEFNKKEAKFSTTSMYLSDAFINSLVKQILTAQGVQSRGGAEDFTYLNNILRKQNDAKFLAANAKNNSVEVGEFDLESFLPLRFNAKTSNFAAVTNYYYKGKKLGDSTRLGIDLKAASGSVVRASNKGVVAFAGDNGIYGQSVVVNHGFGISSVYSHLSKINVVEGQEVKEDEVIGVIGRSGFVTSTRLQFAVIANGVFVQPEDFMNPVWVEENVKNIVAATKSFALRQNLQPLNVFKNEENKGNL